MALVDRLDLRSASIEPRPEVLTDWRRTGISPTPYRSARFYLGGFCAESRFAPSATRPRNSRLDFERARELLGEKRHWIFLLSAVDEIIAAHWSEVEVVARALLERGTLSGEEIVRTGGRFGRLDRGIRAFFTINPI